MTSPGWGWANNGLSWRALILPNMEGDPAYNALNFDLYADGSGGATSPRSRPPGTRRSPPSSARPTAITSRRLPPIGGFGRPVAGRRCNRTLFPAVAGAGRSRSPTMRAASAIITASAVIREQGVRGRPRWAASCNPARSASVTPALGHDLEGMTVVPDRRPSARHLRLPRSPGRPHLQHYRRHERHDPGRRGPPGPDGR